MEKRKYEMPLFDIFDYTGISRHLEDMAAAGWFIDRPGSFIWRYRAAEPQKLHFQVAYFPKASDYDPEPRPEQQEFQDLCRRTGWTAAASLGQAQFYYNSSEDPEPLETEPYAQIGNLQKAVRKAKLLPNIIILILSAMMLYAFVYYMLKMPLYTLSHSSQILIAAICPLLLAVTLTDAGGYFSWLRRAKKAAAMGEFTDSRPFAVRNTVNMFLLFVLIVLMLLCGSSMYTARGNWSYLTYFMLYMLCMFLPLCVLSPILRRKKVPSGTNKAICMVTALLLIILLDALTSHYLISADKSPASPLSAPPLTASDLGLDESGTFTDMRSDSSPLLGRHYVEIYRPVNKSGTSCFNKHLVSYTITEVKFSPLYGFVRNCLLRENDENSAEEISDGMRWIYEPQDASFWRAGEAYRLVRQDVGSADIWLLCYDGYIVELTFYEPPTDAQLTAAAEKFGGMS